MLNLVNRLFFLNNSSLYTTCLFCSGTILLIWFVFLLQFHFHLKRNSFRCRGLRHRGRDGREEAKVATVKLHVWCEICGVSPLLCCSLATWGRIDVLYVSNWCIVCIVQFSLKFLFAIELSRVELSTVLFKFDSLKIFLLDISRLTSLIELNEFRYIFMYSLFFSFKKYNYLFTKYNILFKFIIFL